MRTGKTNSLWPPDGIAVESSQMTIVCSEFSKIFIRKEMSKFFQISNWGMKTFWKETKWKFNKTRCHSNCFNMHNESIHIHSIDRKTKTSQQSHTRMNGASLTDIEYTDACVNACVRSMVYYLNVTFYSNRYMPLLYMYLSSSSFHQLWIQYTVAKNYEWTVFSLFLLLMLLLLLLLPSLIRMFWSCPCFPTRKRNGLKPKCTFDCVLTLFSFFFFLFAYAWNK